MIFKANDEDALQPIVQADKYMEIISATIDDAPAILELQKLAYHTEAVLYNDWSIPPLIQTFAELRAEFAEMKILKACRGKLMVGSVRAIQREGICSIGRLMVHPEHQRQGIGTRLIKLSSRCFRGQPSSSYSPGAKVRAIFGCMKGLVTVSRATNDCRRTYRWCSLKSGGNVGRS